MKKLAIQVLIAAGTLLLCTEHAVAQKLAVGPTMAAGHRFSLMIRSDGTAWATGLNYLGQLGNGTTIDSTIPIQVPIDNPVVSVAAGGWHSIAVDSRGWVWGWGDNHYNQLADGTQSTSLYPKLLPVHYSPVAIAAGLFHNLALYANGQIYAWGRNDDGQLGLGHKDPVDYQALLYDLPPMVAIAAGAEHSVAVDTEGSLWAWGSGFFGQLGNGQFHTQSSLPMRVSAPGLYRDVACGAYHCLAIGKDNRVYTWGRNDKNQLGDGTGIDRATPAAIGSSGMTSIDVAAGDNHSLSVSPSGAVYVWGSNTIGKLGTGDTLTRKTPVTIGPVGLARSVAAGADHSLFRKADNTVWGSGDIFGAGVGSTANPLVPTPQIRQGPGIW